MDNSAHELVAATLAGLGQHPPGDFFQTMLLRDGYFDGWKLRYDGGYAILHADADTIELFDDEGALLKTIAIEAAKDQAAKLSHDTAA